MELELHNYAILKIIKPLYGVPEAGNHCVYLLYTENSSNRFVIVALQTDDILFLLNKMFAIKLKQQLQ